MEDMAKERNNRVTKTDFLLQWGNRKKLRCLKARDGDDNVPKKSNHVVKKKIKSRAVRPSKLNKKPINRPPTENLKLVSASPEKEERHYTTRGSTGSEENDGKKSLKDSRVEDEGGIAWPKLLISLSSKEKEEDFMAMKGCKLPQRPKKRAKFIQKTLLLVSPGAWLSDLCQERYEVREKKTPKKKARGLKGMGSKGSDSE